MEISIKKLLMKQMWRVQQTQSVISVIFWSLTLTGIFYERANYYLYTYLPFLEEDENKDVITKMAILFFMVVAGVMIFGFLYDSIFRMWEHTSTVMQERNPYTIYKFNSWQFNIMKHCQLPTLKAVNTNGEFDEDVVFMERWMDKVLANDKVLKAHVEHVENWVMSDTIPWNHIDERQITKLRKEQELDQEAPGNGT